MKNLEWYRGTDWDKESQKNFEEKLKKVRISSTAAQYMRIKASYLLKSNDSDKESEGCILMERLINDYPTETYHIMYAFEQLGDYHFKKKNYIAAELNFRKSISFYKTVGRSGTSGIGDIKLAETIIITNQADKFQEMYNLLVNDFSMTGGSLTLNDDIFNYSSVLAKLAFELGKTERAAQFAQKALKLAKIDTPQLDNYPTLGLVQTTKEEVDHLNKILNAKLN